MKSKIEKTLSPLFVNLTQTVVYVYTITNLL